MSGGTSASALQLNHSRRARVARERQESARLGLHTQYRTRPKHQYSVPWAVPTQSLQWRADGAPAESQHRRDTSLLHAVERGDLNLVKNMLKLGPIGIVPEAHREKADILLSAQDYQGFTPLHWAASNGHVDTCEVLLKAGAPKNTIDTKGHTALCEAVIRGHFAAVRTLVEAGADMALRDIAGLTARDWAMKEKEHTNKETRVPPQSVRPDPRFNHFFENRRRAKQQDDVVLVEEDRIEVDFRQRGQYWKAVVTKVHPDRSFDVHYEASEVAIFLTDDAPGILAEIRRQEEEERIWRREHGLDENGNEIYED